MKLRRILSLALAAFAAITLFTPIPAEAADSGIVRVGLLYGSNVTAGANAYAKSGFTLGYFDGDDSFNSIYALANTYVTFAKHTTVFISGYEAFSNDQGGSVKIKPYHLELDATFASAEEVDDIIAMIRANGWKLEVFPAYINGRYKVRIDTFSTADYARADVDKIAEYTGGYGLKVVGPSETGITVIDMNTNLTVFSWDDGSRYLAAAPGDSSDTLKNGAYYYKGAFEFKRMTGENVTLVNVVGMQDYVKGVLPFEMPSSWHIEALKAQAVCARSYAIMSNGKHRSSGFEVCCTTDCQVYRGCGTSQSYNANISRAADETAGEVLTYNGKIIATYFYSSNGGYTEANENVWGGTAYPYYAAVPDDMEELTTGNSGLWTTTATPAELTEYLRSKNYSIDTIVDCYVSQYTNPAGNVYEITFVDTAGKKLTISRCDTVRIALSKYVKSARFSVYKSNETEVYVNDGETIRPPAGGMYAIGSNGVSKLPTDPADIGVRSKAGDGNLGRDAQAGDFHFIFDGRGYGHNVGMSQYGAKGRAEAGYNYEEIVTYYFPGTKLTYSAAYDR